MGPQGPLTVKRRCCHEVSLAWLGPSLLCLGVASLLLTPFVSPDAVLRVVVLSAATRSISGSVVRRSMPSPTTVTVCG